MQIIVDIKNRDILNKIPEGERENFKQRLLSVLDIRKMFQVKEDVYKAIKFEVKSLAAKQENQRMLLMMKEYCFLENRLDKIEERADSYQK